MPAQPFIFSGPPSNGVIYSEWVDLSVFLGASKSKTLSMTTPGGGNSQLATQVQMAGDSPSQFDRTPKNIGSVQKGGSWDFECVFSANFVRLMITNAPDSPDPLGAFVGLEYTTSLRPDQTEFASGDLPTGGSSGTTIVTLTIPSSWDTSPGVVCEILVSTESATPVIVSLERTGKTTQQIPVSGVLVLTLPRDSAAPGDVFTLKLFDATSDAISAIILVTTNSI